jgi:methionyl aminopeptidase
VLAAAVPGAKVCDLCALGDKTVEAEAAKFYNKKDKDGNKIDKGIAFPTCVSVNNQVCHNSPLDDNTVVLEEGQAVKIDLGAHVDGYIAVVANTVVLMGDANAPVTGQQADVMQAAITAGEAAIRKLRPGSTNNEVAGRDRQGGGGLRRERRGGRLDARDEAVCDRRQQSRAAQVVARAQG